MFTRLAGDPEALRAKLKGRIEFRVFRDVSGWSPRFLDRSLLDML
jgi:hypothetical protein